MYERELHLALRLARQASRVVLRYYRRRSRVLLKPNETPVTAADRAAERLIVSGLRRVFPHDHILGEEFGHRRGGRNQRRFWTIDPIDGTRQFIKKSGEFCVMIGLVVDGRPVMGVVAAPALDLLASATLGGGAFLTQRGRRRRMHVRLRSLQKSTVVGPRIETVPSSFPERARHALRVPGRLTIGSFGLRSLMVARGRADLFLSTMLDGGAWDVVPNQLIVTEAGGVVTSFSGQPIRYTWGTWRISGGFIAMTPPLVGEVQGVFRQRRLAEVFRRERRRALARTARS